MESLRPLTEEIRINCVMFVVGDVQLSEALCSYNSSKDFKDVLMQRCVCVISIEVELMPCVFIMESKGKKTWGRERSPEVLHRRNV